MNTRKIDPAAPVTVGESGPEAVVPLAKLPALVREITRTPTAAEALNNARLDVLANAIEEISPCLIWRDSGGFASYMRSEGYDATAERAGLFEVVISLDGCNPDDLPAIAERLHPGGALLVEMPVPQHDDLFDAAGFDRLTVSTSPFTQLWRLR